MTGDSTVLAHCNSGAKTVMIVKQVKPKNTLEKLQTRQGRQTL